MNRDPYNLLHSIQQQFDHVAGLLELDQATRDFLRVPVREYHFSIPIRMDDGGFKVFRGYRIQHNDACGPCKGGIRFHPLESVDVIRALAMLMTWKSAAVDLPLGGSMGGIDCDLHDLSLLEQERLCRGWVRQVSRNVGPEQDIPGLDLMASDQHMLWILDEFETIQGRKQPGFITGKPVGLGGSLGRKEATGYGVMLTVREALKDLGMEPETTRASFQGFGNVAQYAIQLFQKMGGKVICVSCWDQIDRTSYSYRKIDGINLAELQSITNAFGEIDRSKAGEFGYECLPGTACFEQEVEILVPAAIENQITAEITNRISGKVKIIAEAANNPSTPDALPILNERGIIVIPDLLANAGGFICSYYEQVQGNMNYFWNRDEVLGKIDAQLTNAYFEITHYARENKLNIREAAYFIAVNRVAQACQVRGWV